MAVRSALGLVMLAHGVAGARIAKSSQQTMAGVKVHNFRSDVADWMVVFKEGASDADIKDFCQGKCDFHGHPDAQGAPFAKVHGLAELKQMVAEHPEKIELVEPDEIDWAIDASEEMAGASWGLDAVGVDRRSGAGRGVHIYVQDTGIRGSHNDFGGRVLPTIDLTSGSLVVCSDSSCAADRQGHGTHCAGTAGGRTYGVASEATLHAVKTLSDQGSGARSWQMSAIDWITTNGAKPSVISMSLGGSGSDPAYTTAIGAATRAGIVVVVAAGNSNADTCNFSPAFVADAITVGSTTSSNSRSSFSNFGTCNDIFAPGSSITSTSSSSDTGSRSLSGTSMACPHVSGAAAILLQENPSLGRSGVMAIMQENGKRGQISGLQSGDPDLFLWLGAPPAGQSIVGINSYSCLFCNPPAEYLFEDTNQGHFGRYVYIKPRYEESSTGIAGFEFHQYESSWDGGSRVTGDLAEGTASGNYRYLVPVGSRPAETAVNRVWWSETQSENCTSNINEGRVGRTLYLCWSHFSGN